MKSIFVVGVSAILTSGALGQTTSSAGRGTLFAELFPEAVIWEEKLNGSGIYYDQGSGLQHVMINTDTPTDGSAYLTVNADVGANGWYGMVMQSSVATGNPYYKYVAGSNTALHWFNADTGYWALSINATQVFNVSPAGNGWFDGNVTADRFKLNGLRHSNAWVTQFQPALLTGANERVYTLQLPHNATVAGATLIAIDNNASYNYTATLYPTSLYGAVGAAVFTVTTTGSAAGARDFYAASIPNPTINANDNSYIVVLSSDLATRANLAFVTLRIWYTEDSL